MHAQVAAYVREKKLAEVDALDSRALDLDWDGMLDYVKKSNPDMVFVGELFIQPAGLRSSGISMKPCGSSRKLCLM